MPGLPSGHPDVSQMPKADAAAPVDMNAKGKVKVRAVQGTKDGPAISGDKVTLELYVENQPAGKFESKLDDKGEATFEALPLYVSFVPLVTVNHAGVDYPAFGKPMNRSLPEQGIQLQVYEATDKAPEWTVRMRHLMVEPGPDGLSVVEMLQVENPSDRSWIGTPRPDGARAAMSLAVPAGAKDIKAMGGFDDCCVKIENDHVINTKAMFPGISQYQLHYMIPAIDGAAALTIPVERATKHLMLFAPADDSQIAPNGLTAMGSRKLEDGEKRFYGAAQLTPGQTVGATFTNLPKEWRKAAAEPGSAMPGAQPGAPATMMPKALAAVGAVLILVFGAAFVLIKPKKASR